MGVELPPEKFWAKDPLALIQRFDIIPREHMTLEAKLNALTRLVILIFIVLLIIRYRYAAAFLLAALLIILIMYRFQKERERPSKSEKKSSIKKRKESEWNDDEDDSRPRRFMTNAGRGDLEQTEDHVEVSAKNKSTNPRKPYPPTIPADFVVKNAYGQVLNSDPRYEQYVKSFGNPSAEQVQSNSNRREDKFLPREDEEMLKRRAETRKKAFGGGPRVNYKMSTSAARYHGYQARDFEDFEVGAENEAEEDSDNESEPDVVELNDISVAKEEVQTKIPVPVQTEKPRRRFLPSNYDSSLEQPMKETISRSERARPKARGMGRNARLVASESDSGRSTRKYDHDEILFSKNAKATAAARARANNDRLSEKNTLFSNS